MSKAENPNQGQTKIIIQGDSGFEYQGKKYHFQDMGELQFDSRELRDIDLLEKKRIVNLQKLFTPEGMDLMIAEIQKEVADFSADISTKKGRAEIISMAAKVAKCKSPIKNLASELKEESRRLIDGVNAQWNRYESAMDTLRDEIRKPVDEIEEREAAQLKACQDRLSQIESLKDCGSTPQAWSSVIMNCEIGITNVKDFLENFEWGQFKFKAETAANEVLEILNLRCAHAKEQKVKDDELDKLRKEAAERAQKDHEAAIAAEAAEKAKLAAEMEAEKKAKAIREAAEAEQARVEAEKLKAEEEKRLAEQAKINAEKRAQEAERLAAEQAAENEKQNRIRVARYEFEVAETKRLAEEGKIAAEKKAKEDAEKAAAEAVKKEQERVAEQKRLDDAAAEKLAADKEHCAKINQEAHLKIYDILLAGIESEKDQASAIIEAIAKGEVPHVQINY